MPVYDIRPSNATAPAPTSIRLPDITPDLNYLASLAASNEYYRRIYSALDGLSRSLVMIKDVLGNSTGSGITVPASLQILLLSYDAGVEGYPLLTASDDSPIFRNGLLQKRDIDYAITTHTVRFILYPSLPNDRVEALVS